MALTHPHSQSGWSHGEMFSEFERFVIVLVQQRLRRQTRTGFDGRGAGQDGGGLATDAAIEPCYSPLFQFLRKLTHFSWHYFSLALIYSLS